MFAQGRVRARAGNASAGSVSTGNVAPSSDTPSASATTQAQCDVLEHITPIYDYYCGQGAGDELETIALHRDDHVAYLHRAVHALPAHFASLDASRPWLCYWVVHALSLLDGGHGRKSGGAVADVITPTVVSPIVSTVPTVPTASRSLRHAVVETLRRYQDVRGGFGGGYMQVPHLAPTYAAVMALVSVHAHNEAGDGGDHGDYVDALAVIDRTAMYDFLMRMKQADGSFVMHEGGEVDVRGSYCAMAVASLLNIVTPELSANVAEFIACCQTYEGGIGAYPGCEAHGGYTYCAIAALAILQRIDVIDRARLLDWASARQMSYEGGFQGRTNKLVDGCYSFWQGGVFPLLNTVMDGSPDLRRHLYDRSALQHFILLCSQNEHHPATASTTGGGFSDRPENSVDLYHTCYCLSGLSSAQHDVRISPTPPFFAEVVDGGDEDGATRASSIIVGRRDNAVGATHPMFNVRVDQANAALARFYDRIEEVA